MESIKSALGLGGSTTQSGQEPVSGETGSGTVEQPYDGGNVQGKSRHQTSSIHAQHYKWFPECNFEILYDGIQDTLAPGRMTAWTAQQQA